MMQEYKECIVCFLTVGGAAVKKIEGKKKGRPRADNQELRNIPVSKSRALLDIFERSYQRPKPGKPAL